MHDPNKNWIQTYRGEQFWPMDPCAEDIDIIDIAHALSNVGRFTGHTKLFYSVAEHSVHVARRVFAATGSYAQALQGLLHDASEAYLADIAKPVKIHPSMAPYREAEARLERMILEKFDAWRCLGKDEGLTPAVREADLRMLATEARDLMSPLHADWKGLAHPYPELDVTVPWRPATAERSFLGTFNAIQDEMNQ